MSIALTQASVVAIAAATYALLRIASTGKVAEAVASSILMGAFLFALLHRRQVVSLKQVGQAILPKRNAWLAAIIAFLVAGMGVVRHGVPVHTALLDAGLAFIFFLAFGSFFTPKRVQ